MILFTLGTSPYPFDRAVRWLLRLLQDKEINEKVVLQYGATNVMFITHPEVEKVPGLLPEQMRQVIRDASIVISHAGQGSTRLLAAEGKKFIILPRRKKFGEHVDDHQFEFSRAMHLLGVPWALEFDELKTFIKNPPLLDYSKLFKAPILADYLLERYSSRKT